MLVVVKNKKIGISPYLSVVVVCSLVSGFHIKQYETPISYSSIKSKINSVNPFGFVP